MRRDKILPSKTSSGNMKWFFIGLAIIMFVPSLAPLLPFILLFWYFKKTSGASCKDKDSYLRQNPHRNRNRPTAHEPEHYRPKSYRINDIENPYTDIQPDSYVRTKPKQQPQKQQSKPRQQQKPTKITNKKQEKQNANRYIYPLLAGALATIIVLFMLDDRLVASMAGIGVAVISSLIVFITQRAKKPKIAEGDELIIEQGHAKADKIQTLAAQLDDRPSMQWEVEEISNVVRDIFQNFVDDPEDIKQARAFIRHDLDDAIKLIETYIRVVKSKLNQEDERITAAENSIINVRESFQKLQVDLLENDLLDLEIQSKTLKSVLKNSANFVDSN